MALCCFQPSSPQSPHDYLRLIHQLPDFPHVEHLGSRSVPPAPWTPLSLSQAHTPETCRCHSAQPLQCPTRNDRSRHTPTHACWIPTFIRQPHRTCVVRPYELRQPGCACALQACRCRAAAARRLSHDSPCCRWWRMRLEVLRLQPVDDPRRQARSTPR